MNDEIEWLNNLDIPSCALVTSVEDLHSGVVLCDVVAYLKSRPFFEDISRHAEVQKNFKKAALNNFKIFYREIGGKLPISLVRAPEEIYNYNESLLEIVEFLQQINSKPRLNLKELKLQPKLTRNFTPRGRLVISPRDKTPGNRLNHSPSMLDIHIQSNVPDFFKDSIIS